LAPAFSPHIGTQEYMQAKHKLDVQSVVQSILELLPETVHAHAMNASGVL
jgi:hypothetical protein